MWPEKDTYRDKKKILQIIHKNTTLCALSKVVFRVPLRLHLPKKNIKWYKLQDTFVATSSLGVAGLRLWALRHPPKAIGILRKVLQQLLATSVTTANNVSSRYARRQHLQIQIHLHGAQLQRENNSLPEGFTLFLRPLSLSLQYSLSPLYPLFFNCAWPTLLERNCNRSALFLQKYLTDTRSDSCICKAQLGMDRDREGGCGERVDPCTGCSKCLGTSHSFMQHATDASRR